MALATLYGHNLDLSSCDVPTARGLLAAGYLLGIDSVANAGYQVLVNSITKENLPEVLAFALGDDSNKGADGKDAVLPLAANDKLGIDHPGPYPPLTGSLVSILVNFILNNYSVSVPVDAQFKSIMLGLPFQLVKHIVESDKLQAKSPMERHSFARDIVGAREKNKKRGEVNYEESVVLAFGGGKGGVEVIRKTIGGKKALWKVTN